MKKIKDRAALKAAIKRRKKTVYEPVKPAKQLGFVHNNVDCIGCRACEIACKDKNGLPPGPRFRRVQYIEGGTYPHTQTPNTSRETDRQTDTPSLTCLALNN